MRFDIVLNNLCGLAWTEHKIAMTSDGTPWRPLVHALDIAQAIGCALRADRETVHRLVVNVGADDNNRTIRQIAETVGRLISWLRRVFRTAKRRPPQLPGGCFGKIRQVFPDLPTYSDIAAGAAQLHRASISSPSIPRPLTAAAHTRLKQIEYLLMFDQVDEQLFWRYS